MMLLRTQNAVILHTFPAHPSGHETERMDGAQPGMGVLAALGAAWRRRVEMRLEWAAPRVELRAEIRTPAEVAGGVLLTDLL
jgi:MYXO-CTERM domain-containing protein